jgi:hypothetical protein
MTGDQSRTLSVGDRVCWHADKKDLGTVTEKNWAGANGIIAASKQFFTTTWRRSLVRRII